MRPVEPPEIEGTQRFVWLGTNPEMGDLPVRFDPSDGTSLSVWSLSLNERRAILDGARIILQVSGRHPPVGMMVEGVTEE